MTYQDIMSETIDALPKTKVVLELLEDIKIDQRLIERVRELSKQGFLIALDDFIYSSDWEPLIDSAQIIKLDLTALSNSQNQEIIQKLKNRGLKFLAEKVETYEEFEAFKAMGCDYFQGYFLCKPEKISGKSLTSSVLAKTRLLAEINDPNSSSTKISELIQQDPALTYKLIKYLNSAIFSFSNPIESVQHATIMIGLQGVKNWATLLSLRGLSNKPSELTRVSLIRAKLAEIIASSKNANSPSSFFLSGLFSTLDAMLDCSMQKILSSMPIEANIKAALSDRKGEIGQTLQEIIDYENGIITSSTTITSDQYIEACTWADDILLAIDAS